MKYLELTLVMKSGATLTAAVDEIKASRSPISGELTQLNWTHVPQELGLPRLFDVNIAEVAAISTRHVDDGTAEEAA
ncbi:hypothetical protein GCM10023081_46990 [Arthrobacter ginkgonis]|uniref:Uncharacterized protein n=1 Tax=Arthrobacter ginkgonis TaxID=1630594 RepID=A0ABP7DKK9_9MICC